MSEITPAELTASEIPVVSPEGLLLGWEDRKALSKRFETRARSNQQLAWLLLVLIAGALVAGGFFVFQFAEDIAERERKTVLAEQKKEAVIKRDRLTENIRKSVDGMNADLAKTLNWRRIDVTGEDVFFLDAQRGWAVGSRGTILATANGGATWAAQSSGTQNSLWAVHFTDAQRGWAVGSRGTILATANGGATWAAQSSGTQNSLLAVHFTDAQRGWAVGSRGTILATANGGATWSSRGAGWLRAAGQGWGTARHHPRHRQRLRDLGGAEQRHPE